MFFYVVWKQHFHRHFTQINFHLLPLYYPVLEHKALSISVVTLLNQSFSSLCFCVNNKRILSVSLRISFIHKKNKIIKLSRRSIIFQLSFILVTVNTEKFFISLIEKQGTAKIINFFILWATMEDRNKDDPRLEFLNIYLQKTFRLKGDKWQKLMTSDDRVNNYFVSNVGSRGYH